MRKRELGPAACDHGQVVEPGDLRAGDADRERAVDLLRRHHAAGRLDDDELEERMGGAYAARTYGALTALVEDLPELPAGVIAPIVPRRVPARGWGLRSFHQEHELPTTPEATWRDVIGLILPAMERAGYAVVGRRSHEELVLERSEPPAWTILCALLLFPFGLLALLHRRREQVHIEVEPRRGGGTLVVVHGRARRGIRRTFAELSAA